jgi:hypothetical protein
VKKVIPILLLASLLGAQLALIGFDIASSRKLDEQVAVAAQPEPMAGNIGIEEVLPNATTTAQIWKSDATLVEASIQIDWPDDWATSASGQLPPGGWVLLGYISGTELLTMRIERGGGIIVQMQVTQISEDVAADYRSNVFDIAAAKQTSADAAMAFDIAHGAAFRQACAFRRGQSYLHPEISSSSGQWVWAISYLNRRENDPAQYMTGEIDWATGSIDQVVDTNLPCDPAPG